MRKRCILITACSICLCIALLPYLLVLLHVSKMKRDLNNPIINGEYQNWQDVSLDDNIAIKIPDTWSRAFFMLFLSDSTISGRKEELVLAMRKFCAYNWKYIETARLIFGSKAFVRYAICLYYAQIL